MNEDAKNKKVTRTRSRRMWWKLPTVLLVVLMIVVAMLPTFVSWGLGKGIIAGQVEKQINGTVIISHVSASWFGEQTVRGFSITAPDSVTTVDVTATLHASLLDIIFTGVDKYEIDITGEMAGELREDGSLSFQDLIKPSLSTTPTPPAAPSSRSRVPGAVVNFSELKVTMLNEASNETFVFDEINGKLDATPGGLVTLSLAGKSLARDQRGDFIVEADATGAVDATGAFTPAGASTSVAIHIGKVPALFTSQPTFIHALEIQADSADLTRRIDLTMSGKATVEGNEPSSMYAELAIENPFNAAGDMTIGVDGITGTISGTRVPTAVLQPFLAAGSPVILERDLGPDVTVSADFATGEQKRINVSASSNAARLDIAGVIDTTDRSFVASRVLLNGQVHPALALALTKIKIDQTALVQAEFTHVSVPPIGADGAFNLAGVALTGFVSIDNELEVTLPAEAPRTMQLHRARINIESDSLGSRVRAFGSAGVDELTVEFDESVTHLVDASGAIAFDALVPVGTVTVKGITDATLIAFAPGLADLVTSNKVLPASAVLATTATDRGWSAALTVTGNKLDALATAVRTDEAVRVQLDSLSMRVSPALVAFLQSTSESPVELLGPAQLALTSEPIDFPAAELANVDFAGTPIRLMGTLEDATLSNIPALDEAVVVRGFDATINVRMKPERWYGADGTASLALAADNMPLSNVRFDVSLAEADGAMTPTGMVKLTDLSVAALERANGRDAGTFESLVGATGDVQLTLDREGDTIYSNVNTALTNLHGTFAASLTPDLLTLTADTSRFVLSKAALNRFLARGTSEAAEAATQGATLTAITDLPLNAKVRSLQLPIGMITAEPIDPALVDIDISLTGGPVSFTESTIGTLTSESLAASIKSKNLSRGVELKANVSARPSMGDVTRPAGVPAESPTLISLTGTLFNLLDKDSRVSMNAATLNMTADASRVPTALVDAAGAFGGVLTAALGPQVQAWATAEEFSLNTGKLRTRLEANNGWMEGIMKGRDGMLQLSVNNPLRAELEITPELRDRLLYKIHPVLADIRTTEQPLRVLVPNASMPVNGDISKLNARIEITIGAVELDGGSTTLFLLKLFNAGSGAKIPGSIEPIVANIVNGVLTYEKFAVNVDKYHMNYSGTIDLNTGQVNLRTELPLQALSATITELRGYTDNITVPIVTRGQFGNLKTQIDPSFDIAKEALKGGLKGALDDLFGGKQNEQPDEKKPEDKVKNFLDDLLRGAGRDRGGNQNNGSGGDTSSNDGAGRDRGGSQNNKGGGSGG